MDTSSQQDNAQTAEHKGTTPETALAVLQTATDSTGAAFDPALHAKKGDGSPWIMPKSGKFRAAKGKSTRPKARKRSRISKLVQTPERLAELEASKAQKDATKAAKTVEDMKAAARLNVAAIMTGCVEKIGVALAGPDGKLKGPPVADTGPENEREAMTLAFASLMEAYPAVADNIPPWTIPGILIGGYALRVAQAENEEKKTVFSRFKDKCKSSYTYLKGWYEGRSASTKQIEE